MEYARGISKPNDLRADEIESYYDQTDDDASAAQESSEYQHNENATWDALDNKHNQFASEIDKIRSMFS